MSAHQRQSTLYVEGVSCPQCHALSTTEQKSRFAERQRQVKLAEERGQMHIGEAQQVNKMLNKAADTNQYQDGGAALPVLYSFRRCPYAMRARMAILVSGQTCAIREVALKNMPQEMLSASAKGTVPVLELPNGKVLDESLDIMHWALGIHDPEHWLTPPAETLQDVDAIVAVIDGQFKYHLDRYKYASRYQDADPDSERDAAAATLRPLVARLEIHSHLFGERPCFADIAAAPFVRQFANTDRAWFDAQSWTGLRRWLDAFLGSEMFNQVMTKYPLWRRDDPTTRFPS